MAAKQQTSQNISQLYLLGQNPGVLKEISGHFANSLCKNNSFRRHSDGLGVKYQAMTSNTVNVTLNLI